MDDILHLMLTLRECGCVCGQNVIGELGEEDENEDDDDAESESESEGDGEEESTSGHGYDSGFDERDH
jgi:hypothetical protein